jgi:hypothetical protein
VKNEEKSKEEAGRNKEIRMERKKGQRKAGWGSETSGMYCSVVK